MHPQVAQIHAFRATLDQASGHLDSLQSAAREYPNHILRLGDEDRARLSHLAALLEIAPQQDLSVFGIRA